MSEWIWALICAASLIVTVPVVFHVRIADTRRRLLAHAVLALGYLLLAALFLADALVPSWTHATLRFTRGCVAGLGLGAILGALALIVRRARGSR